MDRTVLIFVEIHEELEAEPQILRFLRERGRILIRVGEGTLAVRCRD